MEEKVEEKGNKPQKSGNASAVVVVLTPPPGFLFEDKLLMDERTKG